MIDLWALGVTKSPCNDLARRFLGLQATLAYGC